MFTDLNGDGILDLVYTNHYRHEPASEWDVGLGRIQLGGTPSFEAIDGSKVFSLSEDNATYVNTRGKSGFRPAYKADERLPIDAHGSALLDIDRDGVLDLYISTGATRGTARGVAIDAVLMWGKSSDGDLGVPSFTGGRDASRVAGLQNEDASGRFAYWADWDGDGLLDVAYANQVRADGDLAAVGKAFVNEGKRSFKQASGFAEFSRTMILTDADGDGRAAELVVQRRECVVGEPNASTTPFCQRKRCGSTAVYVWDRERGDLMDIAPASQSRDDHPRVDCDSAWGSQSGDFDGDGVADLAVLHRDHIKLYYSSRRQHTGQLPIGPPSESVELHGCWANSLRVADFDLDGSLDLLVACMGDAKLNIYMRTRDRDTWTLLDANLGPVAGSDPLSLSFQSSRDGSASTVWRDDEERREEAAPWNSIQARAASPSAANSGFSIVDLDNDGYMDAVLSYKWGRVQMLQNTLADVQGRNGFLAIRLVGSSSNVYGIGATVKVHVGGMGPGKNETVVQLREVNTVSHETDWFGYRDDRLVFGLGPHGSVERVSVRWPGNDREEVVGSDLTAHVNTMSDPLEIHEARPFPSPQPCDGATDEAQGVRCPVWAVDTKWGAPSQGRTLASACATSEWARRACARTCCMHRARGATAGLEPVRGI